MKIAIGINRFATSRTIGAINRVCAQQYVYNLKKKETADRMFALFYYPKLAERRTLSAEWPSTHVVRFRCMYIPAIHETRNVDGMLCFVFPNIYNKKKTFYYDQHECNSESIENLGIQRGNNTTVYRYVIYVYNIHSDTYMILRLMAIRRRYVHKLLLYNMP